MCALKEIENSVSIFSLSCHSIFVCLSFLKLRYFEQRLFLYGPYNESQWGPMLFRPQNCSKSSL